MYFPLIKVHDKRNGRTRIVESDIHDQLELSRTEVSNMIDILDVKNISTRKLLSYLIAARRCGGDYNPYYDSGYAPTWSKTYTIPELKAELATREHIPTSKLERRKIRQLRAKYKQDNGKGAVSCYKA